MRPPKAYPFLHGVGPPTGQPTLIDKDRYLDKELQALDVLRRKFAYPG